MKRVCDVCNGAYYCSLNLYTPAVIDPAAATVFLITVYRLYNLHIDEVVLTSITLSADIRCARCSLSSCDRSKWGSIMRHATGRPSSGGIQ